MRQCLSIAITEMVVPVNNTGMSNDSLICPADYSSVSSANITQHVWLFSPYSLIRYMHSVYFLSLECKKVQLVTRAARLGSIGVFRWVSSVTRSRRLVSATIWRQMDIGLGHFDYNNLQCRHSSSTSIWFVIELQQKMKFWKYLVGHVILFRRRWLCTPVVNYIAYIGWIGCWSIISSPCCTLGRMGASKRNRNTWYPDYGWWTSKYISSLFIIWRLRMKFWWILFISDWITAIELSIRCNFILLAMVNGLLLLERYCIYLVYCIRMLYALGIFKLILQTCS